MLRKKALFKLALMLSTLSFFSYGNEKITIKDTNKFRIEEYKTGGWGYLYDKSNPNERDYWSYQFRVDEMNDSNIIFLTRYAYRWDKTYKYWHSLTDIQLAIDWSRSGGELLCVFGHDYPGMKAMIRIDNNDSITTNTKGCLKLDNALDQSLRRGKEIKIRGYVFPDKSPRTVKISLYGYSAVSDRIRERRASL